MSYKVIKQNYDKVMALPRSPNSLSTCNAYTDQALMNLTYETMSDSDYAKSYPLVLGMMQRYREIKKG